MFVIRAKAARFMEIQENIAYKCFTSPSEDFSFKGPNNLLKIYDRNLSAGMFGAVEEALKKGETFIDQSYWSEETWNNAFKNFEEGAATIEEEFVSEYIAFQRALKIRHKSLFLPTERKEIGEIILNTLYAKPKLEDFTLLGEDKIPIRVNKQVLDCWCHSEYNYDRIEGKVMEVPNAYSNELNIIRNFIYTGEARIRKEHSHHLKNAMKQLKICRKVCDLI